MHASGLIEKIKEESLFITIEGALNDWPDVTQAEVTTTLGRLQEIVTRFCETLEAIDEGEDVPLTLAIQYIELKTRWIGLNNRINYNTIRKGKPETLDALLGGSLSLFLERLEGLVRMDDVDRINEFLAEPVSRAA